MTPVEFTVVKSTVVIITVVHPTVVKRSPVGLTLVKNVPDCHARACVLEGRASGRKEVTEQV